MPDQPAEQDTLAQTDEAIFLECAERFRIAASAENDNRTEAIEDLEFLDGQQWPNDLYNLRKQSNSPTLTINHTASFERRVVNNMRQQRPRIKVHPTGEGSKIEDAKVCQGLIRHVEYRSNASVAYDTAGKSAVDVGWGYFRITSEYCDSRSFEQELKIEAVRNVFTGYADPSAMMPDMSDMDWFIFAEQMKRIDFKRKYPKFELAEWQQAGPGDANYSWDDKENIRLAEYFRVNLIKDVLYQLTTGKTIYKSEWDKIKDHPMTAGNNVQLVMEDGRPRQRQTERRQIEWYRITGRKIVDRRILPGQWIPVIRVEGNVLDLNGDVRRKGMIRDMKDPARQYNYWQSAKTGKLALSSKAPWVAAVGQTDGRPEWESANQNPYSALLYVPVAGPDGVTLPPPQRMPPVEVEAGFVEAGQSAEHDLLAVAGMPHEPQQDTPGTVVSGKALRQRQALSDISHFQYYDNQTMAIAHCGRILLDCFPAYYSEERMQRIIGDDGVPTMTGINQPQQTQGPDGQAIHTIKNDMTTGKYDVVMDTGPGYETRRQEGAEAMLDMLRTPIGEIVVKTGADLVVRNMDFAGADDLANRLLPSSPQGMEKALEGMAPDAKAIVQSMQQQLTQAQQTIQQQALEIKYRTSGDQIKAQTEQGWMQVERDKTHTQADTKLHDTSINAQTKVYDTHVKSTTARDVAEINATAQLLNTNTEAAHDRRAAEQLIDSAQKAVAKGSE